MSFAGYRARTNRRGRAVITGRFFGPGRYKVLARKGNKFGISRFLRVNVVRRSSLPGGPDAATARRLGGG